MKGVTPIKGRAPRTGSFTNPKKFARTLDPITATKKMFMYRDIFGNMGGNPSNFSMGSPKGGGMSSPPKGAGVGNVRMMAAARRMGLL